MTVSPTSSCRGRRVTPPRELSSLPSGRSQSRQHSGVVGFTDWREDCVRQYFASNERGEVLVFARGRPRALLARARAQRIGKILPWSRPFAFELAPMHSRVDLLERAASRLSQFSPKAFGMQMINEFAGGKGVKGFEPKRVNNKSRAGPGIRIVVRKAEPE